MSHARWAGVIFAGLGSTKKKEFAWLVTKPSPVSTNRDEPEFHAQFGEDFSAELVQRPDGKAALQAAVDEYFPYLPSFFGGSKSRNNEIFRKWNIKQRTNDEMRADFMKRATEVSAKYGLTLPEVRQAA